jgi:tRNA 5-methylaminomethyl-2-thiouridine biosynthesis bifunctional protein
MTDPSLSEQNQNLDETTFRAPRHQAQLRDGTLFSQQFDDRFGSDDDPVAESTYVFIEGNRLPQRWQQCAKRPRFCVGEIGFGSGLNFLNTTAHWLALSAESRPGYLHYIGFEQFPLAPALIERVLGRRFPEHPLLQPLLCSYSELCKGSYRRWLGPDIMLDLHIGDAESKLAELESQQGIDAWYLDGFNPAQNPALWQTSLFKQLARLSSDDATCSSYSAAGAVRRGLQESGFTVQRHQGFGRKRHMSRACRGNGQQTAQGSPHSGPRLPTPWFRTESQSQGKSRHAVVVGAGMAGCTTALALARRGFRVQLLDASTAPASGASGIPQLALRPRLYRQRSAESQFYLNAFLQARAFYRDLNRDGLAQPGSSPAAVDQAAFWDELAIIQTANALNKSRPTHFRDYLALYPDSVLTRQSAEALTELAQIPLHSEGLTLRGGRLRADIFCRFCIEHARVEFLPQHRLESLTEGDGHWQLRIANGEMLASETVVLATAAAVDQPAVLSWLQLEQLRGQASLVDSSAASAALNVILSGPKTLFPADSSGQHLIAATYERGRAKNDEGNVHNRANHRENIAGSLVHFGLASEQAGDQLIDCARACVAYRSSTPDRLPVIGPVPDRSVILQRYADLARNAAAEFSARPLDDRGATAPQYLPGLYVNAAHGSYGAVTAAYGAEIVASQISGEAEPAAAQTLDLVSPTRFLIRDLRRQTAAIEKSLKG